MGRDGESPRIGEIVRRLSVRQRDAGYYELGPAGHGPTVSVRAPSRRVALMHGKAALRARGDLRAAIDATFRDNVRITTRRVLQPCEVAPTSL